MELRERVERVLAEMPECDKLNDRSGEWNAIYPFIEWLHENKMTIAKWRDPDAEYENLLNPDEEKGTIEEKAPWLLDHPYPVGLPIENLLYEYFDVDPVKLEQERRRLLESMREAES